MRKLLYAFTIAGLLTIGTYAQQSGGAFIPTFDYTIAGNWIHSGTTAFTGVATLTAPVLGAATATSINKVAITAPASSATLTIATGKTLTASNSLTLAGTDATVLTFPTTSATIARTDSAQTFTGVQTFSSAPVIATITNTGLSTLPTATGGLPVVLYCGSTGTGNQTCSAAAAAATTKIYAGHSTLSSNAAVITFPVAFASTTFDCVADDITTRANAVQMLSTSSSSATITNTTGASDVINWVCVGQ